MNGIGTVRKEDKGLDGLGSEKGLMMVSHDGLEDGFGPNGSMTQVQETDEMEDGLKNSFDKIGAMEGTFDGKLNTALNLDIRHRERRKKRLKRLLPPR
ncbi:hypothetical protein SLE2022_143980 [Rubroshorea leprosula]